MSSLKIISIRTIGYSLILLSLLWLIFAFWPVASAEAAYRFSRLVGTRFVLADEATSFGQLVVGAQEKVITPPDTDFSIVVEKIGANAKVIANVDAGNEREYNAKLAQGVAHAKGTVFPGQPGNSFLFAHSVLNPWDVPRYNAVFYLLRELETGDRVVAFYQGRRYNYTVFEKKEVGASDVSDLTAIYDYPVLTLQTCTPPGTTWKRLIVKARL